MTLHPGETLCVPPDIRYKIKDLGPETAVMLPTNVVEEGEPLLSAATGP